MGRREFLRLVGAGAVAASGSLPWLAAAQAGEEEEMGDSVQVWVTNDGVRVDPERNRYFEDRPDIQPDYPTGQYQKRNLIWDGDRIALHGARNEFISFQVVVSSAEPTRGISVALDHLLGPRGARLDGRSVALFRAWYVRVDRPSYGYTKSSLGAGWYPDALIPVASGEPAAFDLPDAENGIPSQRNQTIWVDLYLPKEIPSGQYRGAVTVSWPGGRLEIPVELAVWDFSLPDEIHCRGDIYNNSLTGMPPEMEMRYYQLARQHRFQPGVVYYRPRLEIDGAQVRIDWGDYDGRLRRYLDGSAFTEAQGYWGPGAGLPVDHLILPFDCERGNNRRRAWPAPQPEGGPTPEFERVWVETARQFREHFDADPHWRRVGKIAFLDGLDESYHQAAYDKMVYYCKLLRQGMGEHWFLNRIDGGYSWEAMRQLNPYVDLWVCHTVDFDADKVRHFRELGTEAWFYGPMVYEEQANSGCGSNTFLDLDLFTCRGVGWAAWKHKCGYCEWEFDWNADTAWREAENYSTDGGRVSYNGSGLLIYRGEAVGRTEPIPSIRLKAHRRGFQDYEYFWLLREAGREAEADALVDSVIQAVPFGEAAVGNRRIWRADPEEWERARLRAGNLLGGGDAPAAD
ncbi:MAG: hypothetical protein ACE149_19640 [Armatimonadota bacterium]